MSKMTPLRFSTSLSNVARSVLMNFGPHTKCKKMQRTIGSFVSFGVHMDLGGEFVFLVYSYSIS